MADFDTLDLADVYAVIAYYLRHGAEVDAYLAEQRRLADEVRREIEARFPQAGLRATPRTAGQAGRLMLRFVADENFKGSIVRGLRRRPLDLDIVRVQDVGLTKAFDPVMPFV